MYVCVCVCVYHGVCTSTCTSATIYIVFLLHKALPYNDDLASVISRSSRTPAPVDATMWHDVKSLVANEMAKVNEKIEGICQKLSTLEIKVQALEAHKGTCTSEAPAEPEKRKSRTPFCFQVCQAKLAAFHLLNACVIMMSSAQGSTIGAAHPTSLHLELLVTARCIFVCRVFSVLRSVTAELITLS